MTAREKKAVELYRSVFASGLIAYKDEEILKWEFAPLLLQMAEWQAEQCRLAFALCVMVDATRYEPKVVAEMIEKAGTEEANK